MSNLKNSIISLQEALKEIIDLFYQQKEHKAYEKLSKTMDVMTETVEMIFRTIGTNDGPSFSQEDLLKALASAMQAMEEKDSILLADILQYELMEQLGQILIQL